MAEFSLPELSADTIDVGSLSQDQSFSDFFSFEPPEPCFAPTASCQVGFSFSGLADGFSAFAFLESSDIPDTAPSGPPTIPIVLEPPGPCRTACKVFGPDRRLR